MAPAHLIIVLPVTGYSFPVTVNILSFTGKVYCDTRCSFFISVTENKFPVTKNIVYFTGKKTSVTDTPFVTGSILPVTGSFSFDMGISHHVIGNLPPITIQGV